MKDDLLVIKYNLLPWYNELDDSLDVNNPDFPAFLRERIVTFGAYSLTVITHKETHLKKVKETKSETESASET